MFWRSSARVGAVRAELGRGEQPKADIGLGDRDTVDELNRGRFREGGT